MDILHVVPTYWPAVRYGGPIYSVHGLCSALAARGHAVSVVTTSVDGPADSDVSVTAPVTLDGVTLHYCAPGFLRRIYHSPAMRRKLASLVPRASVVHLHSVFLWPTLIAARVAAKNQVPYVLSPRGMLAHDLFRRRSTLAKKTWLQLFERKTLAGAAAVHFTTDRERLDFEAMGLPCRRAAVIPNGVGTTLPERAIGERPGQQPGPTVLYVGRINWKKGLDRLIRAIPHVPGVQFVIAGNDEDGDRPRLEQLAGELGASAQLRFIGEVRGDVKQAWLRAATLLALPSYSENFGNIVLEALAEGCPVVVTPEVGLSEVIRDSGAGLVAGGEPAEFAAALSRLLGDAVLRERCARAGLQRVERDFKWSSVAAQMERLYLELAGQA